MMGRRPAFVGWRLLFWLFVIEPSANKSYAQVMASRRKATMTAKKSVKRASRSNVSLSLSVELKRRIKSAAAARELSIKEYLTRLLESESPVRTGRVTAAMIRRSDELRARQK